MAADETLWDQRRWNVTSKTFACHGRHRIATSFVKAHFTSHTTGHPSTSVDSSRKEKEGENAI